MKAGSLNRIFSDNSYSDNVDELNTGLSKLSFSDNINGHYVEIDRDIVSGSEINITHNLKGSPSGFLIARQNGNGFITTGKFWDDKKISIINNGPATITYLKIFIMRD